MDEKRRLELRELFSPAPIEKINSLRDVMRSRTINETSCVDDSGAKNVTVLFDERAVGRATHHNILKVVR